MLPTIWALKARLTVKFNFKADPKMDYFACIAMGLWGVVAHFVYGIAMLMVAFGSSPSLISVELIRPIESTVN